MDQTKNWAFLGGVGAAVLAGIYVLWGPSDKKRKTRRSGSDKCAGLVNLGNTCFLNAVLQGFSSSPRFVNWLGDFIDQHINSDYTGYLAWTLAKTTKVVNNESVEDEDDPYCPVEVIDSLRSRHWVISSDEQDAHELFHVFTQTLDEEITKYPPVVSLLDVSTLDETTHAQTEAVSKTHTMLPKLPSKENDHPFRGRLASQLQCKICAYKSPVKHDTFDSLSLTIPSKNFWGSLTLEGLLRHFISSETVQNVECEGCAKRQKELRQEKATSTPKTTFTKKMTIGKLPECLCMHIQRTVWLNNGMPTKKCDHISFPETLHMDEYVYRSRKDSVTDIDNSKLLGGKWDTLNGKQPLGRPSKFVSKSRPNVTKQMTMLQALNYRPRLGMNGLLGPTAAYSRTNGQCPMIPNGHAAQPEAPSPAVQSASTSPTPAKQNAAEVPAFSASANTAIQAANLSMLLNMPDLNKRSDCKYKLTAVLVHHGDALSGHFVTYRRALPPLGQNFSDRWLYTSDTEVHKVRLSEVLDSNAYMLFYEKV
ncbi:ubiquitin carboxyl-terminal hydrolase 30-like [Lineus longissimus]|uniref:ubiquitin carboxyl-terminal hydrolase 30-like n=1 Tax=Lineus longissimus TaxID=88925 RepID=UPI002B4EA557